MLLYIGPGMGIGAIITVVIVILIVVASLFMILWTPVKQLYRKLFGPKNNL